MSWYCLTPREVSDLEGLGATAEDRGSHGLDLECSGPASPTRERGRGGVSMRTCRGGESGELRDVSCKFGHFLNPGLLRDAGGVSGDIGGSVELDLAWDVEE